MQRKLIFMLFFMVLIAVFALQNSEEAHIRLWFWSVSTSMALVLILTFAAGAIAGILFSLTGRSKNSGGRDARMGSAGEQAAWPDREADRSADPDRHADLSRAAGRTRPSGSSRKAGKSRSGNPAGEAETPGPPDPYAPSDPSGSPSAKGTRERDREGHEKTEDPSKRPSQDDEFEDIIR